MKAHMLDGRRVLARLRTRLDSLSPWDHPWLYELWFGLVYRLRYLRTKLDRWRNVGRCRRCDRVGPIDGHRECDHCGFGAH